MESDLGVTLCGGRQFRWGQRTYIMGVLNLTPDSFSGDGVGHDIDAAIERGRQLVADGADILDVGGESTRPDSAPVSAEEETERVIPVLERLVAGLGVPISIDTYKSPVARRALEAGASMVNDVWGLRRDPGLARVAAEWKVPLVIAANQRDAEYAEIVAEVIASLRWGIDTARSAGVARENIIVDPGIGFGKTVEGNLELIRRLGELKALGRPILLGTSRKSVIGAVLPPWP
jgi:dihydropteroate synthase